LLEKKYILVVITIINNYNNYD